MHSAQNHVFVYDGYHKEKTGAPESAAFYSDTERIVSNCINSVKPMRAKGNRISTLQTKMIIRTAILPGFSSARDAFNVFAGNLSAIIIFLSLEVLTEGLSMMYNLIDKGFANECLFDYAHSLL